MYASLSRTTPESGLAAYIRQIKQYPMLSAEEEHALAMRVFEDQDIESAHTLVVSHLRLVVKTAFQMRRYGVALMDLISEGSIGLMTAVKKFNPYLGYRLSTYALWWIKASIQEFVIKTCSLVKIGTTVAQKKLFFNLNKLKARIQNFSENAALSLSDADVKIISTQLNVTEMEVKEMDMRMSKGDVSLDAEMNHSSDENSSTLLSVIPDQRKIHDIAIADKDNLLHKKKLFSEGMLMLNAREQDVVQARCLKENADTLDTLSIKYGVSRERIRQIESRAIEKLKAYCSLKAVA